MTAPKPLSEHLPKGAPSLFDDAMRTKIQEVAALDGTIEEMAYYCGVHKTTISRWLKENPDLYDQVEALRERPVLAARQEVIKGIKDDKNFAFRYLERKRAKEFMPSAKIEHSGTVETTTPEITKAVEEVKEKYEREMRQVLAAPEAKPEEATPPANETHAPSTATAGE